MAKKPKLYDPKYRFDGDRVHMSSVWYGHFFRHQGDVYLAVRSVKKERIVYLRVDTGEVWEFNFKDGGPMVELLNIKLGVE